MDLFLRKTAYRGHTFPRHESGLGFRRGSARLRPRAERARNDVPSIEEWVRRREVKHEATHRHHHLSSQLEQTLTERLNLCPCTGGPSGSPTQLLHHDVRRGGHEDPKLIRPEPGAARPVNLQPTLELLDAVLHVPALAVHLLVDRPRPPTQVGHDEPGIVLGLLPLVPDHLGLDDDTARLRPSPGRILALPIDMFGLVREL